MSIALLSVCLLALWLLSLKLRDSSIIDPFWGPAFSVLYWPEALAHGLGPRSLLVGGLVSLWGLRLGAYLAWRNWGHGEDKRYTAMRRRHGAAWWWRSLFIVFALQGVLAFIVASPIRAVAQQDPVTPLGPIDGVALALVVIGIAFESIGDLQLARFKARPQNRGRVCDQGLWRYTRHPNYFGDFCVWWGLWLVTVPTVVGLAAVVGPIVMSLFLMKVSGVPMLERMIGKRRPGYEEYVRRTNAFFPGPPKAPAAEGGA